MKQGFYITDPSFTVFPKIYYYYNNKLMFCSAVSNKWIESMYSKPLKSLGFKFWMPL